MKIFTKARCFFTPLELATLLAIFLNLEKGSCIMNISTLDRITLSLHRDMKFMFERPEQMNVDAIFGLNFVEVHTAAVLEHKNAIFLKEGHRRILQDISKLCKIARNDGSQLVEASIFATMIRPDIWNRTILWKHGDFEREGSTSLPLARANAATIIYQGTPSETESSRCLEDLLVRTSRHNILCEVSKECGEMLVRKDSSRGYPLTHRLLYAQTAIALGCKEHSAAPFQGLENIFCAAIFQDLIDLESINFPPPSSDLAMEQILLCGMEGYLEFANEHYANLIASWPNSHGCYSALGFDRDEGRINRDRRSTNLMDHGCDNHASGVAAASLSLLIRSAVENFIPDFTY